MVLAITTTATTVNLSHELSVDACINLLTVLPVDSDWLDTWPKNDVW